MPQLVCGGQGTTAKVTLPLPCESQNLNSDSQPLVHLPLPADTSPSLGENIPTQQNCSECSPGDNDFTLCLKLT